MTKKIYIIAGENSGDKLGAKLINSLKAENNNIQYYGIGGAEMTHAGLKSLFPISEINMMGLLEIIPHIFNLKKRINETIQDIINTQPDCLITIDAPGFNFRVAKAIKKQAPHIKLIHYVAPSVWAWKAKRAEKISKIYDLLLTLLPFENKHFTKYGLESYYVGHSIFEESYKVNIDDFIKKYNIDNNLIAITPGSRKSELKQHLPVLNQVIKNILQYDNKYKFAILLASAEQQQYIAQFMMDIDNKHIIYTSDNHEKYQALQAAKIAIAKSGTNTLEIAALQTPMLVFYKLNWLTSLIVKKLVKVKFASLVNIIEDKEIIKEFLLTDCRADLITAQALKLLSSQETRNEQLSATKKALEKLGYNHKEKASLKAAKKILQIIA